MDTNSDPRLQYPEEELLLEIRKVRLSKFAKTLSNNLTFFLTVFTGSRDSISLCIMSSNNVSLLNQVNIQYYFSMKLILKLYYGIINFLSQLYRYRVYK